MATKKNIKVRDLKPSKDAKGGGAGVNHGPGTNKGPAINTTKASGGGKAPSHHGHTHVN